MKGEAMLPPDRLTLNFILIMSIVEGMKPLEQIVQ